MAQIIFFLVLITIFSGCDQELKSGIKNFEEKKFSESTEIFRKILEKDKINEKKIFNLGNSLYKEKKFLEAEKNFKQIYENKKISKKITKLQQSGKIEYQLGNVKYKIGEKIENPKKLSNERKMQRIFGKNFDKIIENYQESIANYKLGIEKNNLNLKKNSENLELINLNKFLTENLKFVEDKLKKTKEEQKKEQEKQNKKNGKKPQKSNSGNKNQNKNGDKNKNQKKNKLDKDQLKKLQNQLDKLNEEEVELKGGFDRFGKNEFKLKNEPGKMEMQTLEEFLSSEKNKKEKIFNSGEKDW